MALARYLALMAALSAPDLAAAQADVIHFSMTPDAGNGAECSVLDPGLRGIHTLTVDGNKVEIASAGGLEGRLTRLRPGEYRIAFELDGRRLDGIADLAVSPQRLIVTERGHPCRWTGKAQ